jgi:hypothetical protein
MGSIDRLTGKPPITPVNLIARANPNRSTCVSHHFMRSIRLRYVNTVRYFLSFLKVRATPHLLSITTKHNLFYDIPTAYAHHLISDIHYMALLRALLTPGLLQIITPLTDIAYHPITPLGNESPGSIGIYSKLTPTTRTPQGNNEAHRL